MSTTITLRGTPLRVDGDLPAVGSKAPDFKLTSGALAERIRNQSVLRGEGAAQFVRIAVADFLAEASEEDWTSLMSAVRDAVDPGAACLAKMTAFRLALEVAA